MTSLSAIARQAVGRVRGKWRSSVRRNAMGLITLRSVCAGRIMGD